MKEGNQMTIVLCDICGEAIKEGLPIHHVRLWNGKGTTFCGFDEICTDCASKIKLFLDDLANKGAE